MKNIGLLLFFFLAAMIIGCGGRHHYPQSLTEADSLADHNPDSAIHYLEGLAPQMADAPEADRMYYQLLCIKATDKAYIPHTSDSLIRPVIDYYEQGGDPRLLPVAYYYGGRVNLDLGDAPQAIGYYLKSLDAMPFDSFCPLRGKVLHQLGRLYWDQHVNQEALSYYQAAFENDISMKDTVGAIFNMEAIAGVYEDKRMPDSALFYYQSAYHLTEQSHDSILKSDICTQLARYYVSTGRVDQAKPYMLFSLQHIDEYNLNALYGVASKYYIATHQIDSAIYFSQLKLARPNIFSKEGACRQLTDLYIQKGDLIKANEYIILYKQYNDSARGLMAAEEVARVNALYNYQLREKENARLREAAQKRKVITSLSLIVCVFMTILVVLLWQYHKKKRFALSLKLEKYRKIVQDYQQKSESKKKLSLSNLISTDLYWQLKKDLSEGKRITDDQIKELTLFFSREKPSFRDELSKLTRLNNYHYLICMLVVMGFNASEIAHLTCKTPQAINSVRQRLYEKAFGEKGSPKKWDDIIFSLSET
ncbi:MAG: hypothetical protein IKX36_02465 [Prevotella sp.]|nr:hypothetical protein [Prevotella sp.]